MLDATLPIQITIIVEDGHNHKANCPALNFNAFGRNFDPMYPTPSQSQDCTTFYPMYGLPQTTVPPTISPGTGSYFRTQPAVFSPFYNSYEGYNNQTHDSWPPVHRPQREIDGRTPSNKERSTPKAPAQQSSSTSSCLFNQGAEQSYVELSEQCFMSRSNNTQQTSRPGSQKQLPSIDPTFNFIVVPEDGTYSPAPFTFQSMTSDGFADKSTAFSVVDELPSESCIPFPPVPSHQPPSCLLETSTGDQDSDLGSDEHEIIVEETGEDALPNMLKQNCAICCESCGWSAVPIREDHPLTLSSQTAVWVKLQQIIGAKVKSKLREGVVMCSKCLHLLNTVDQLQAQLTETSARLVERLKINEAEMDFPHQNPNHKLVFFGQPEREQFENGAVVPEPVLQLAEEAPKLDSKCPSPEISKNLKCDVCGKEFNTKRSITSHMRQHIKHTKVKIRTKFICELCGKQFNHRNNLADHKPVCSGVFPHNCSTCGKGFILKTKLRVHEATHEGKYPLRCEICQKGFLKTSDLSVHKRTHSGEKPFICEICGKSFASVGNYNHHAKLHRDEKPFVCSICNKRFTRKGYLMVHLNRHNGNKPFQCNKCDKSFPDRSNLYHHKRLHEGYKPYTCPICNKALSSGLQAHIRTHTGIRPFTCKKCGQSFTASNSLKKHMTRHD
ncbi:zinc finger protein 26-like isoform X2 [Neocloeon triangulifer]|uniref:zinc finger protein 26-like isoform X2 n=1 Tax=Neocloeon triangulifer TaxID=2078957 RepID=UPI00286EEBFE|nr:zinc finger protein 26-like isoform X2 [Neocloeon triangulifer]